MQVLEMTMKTGVITLGVFLGVMLLLNLLLRNTCLKCGQQATRKYRGEYEEKSYLDCPHCGWNSYDDWY